AKTPFEVLGIRCSHAVQYPFAKTQGPMRFRRMYPHRIRLRSPWQVEPLAENVHDGYGGTEVRKRNLPPVRAFHSPGLWKACGLPEFAGIVRYRRHFGLPRKLDENETVWITCAGVADCCIVWLNGERLAYFTNPRVPFEVEVTGKLK